MTARLAFLDTETTGLDPDLHEIWEVGLILRDEEGTETEHTWQLPVDLGRADPIALKINRYHERDESDGFEPDIRCFAQTFARLTNGAHLVGAVISFDEERLRKLLRKHGECPMWHYHLIDVEALAAGWLAANGIDLAVPPWKSDDLSAAVGVDRGQFDKHTALGDAQWARAVYDAVQAQP